MPQHKRSHLAAVNDLARTGLPAASDPMEFGAFLEFLSTHASDEMPVDELARTVVTAWTDLQSTRVIVQSVRTGKTERTLAMLGLVLIVGVVAVPLLGEAMQDCPDLPQQHQVRPLLP